MCQVFCSLLRLTLFVGPLWRRFGGRRVEKLVGGAGKHSVPLLLKGLRGELHLARCAA